MPVVRRFVERNGLLSTCRLTVDKIGIVPKVGTHVERLGEKDTVRLNQAMMVFLGTALSSRGRRK